MEKRLGIVAIIIENKTSIPIINKLLSENESIINARLGLPMRERGISLISLVIEGNTDEIGSLTGKLGRISGAKVKSLLTSYREETNDKIG